MELNSRNRKRLFRKEWIMTFILIIITIVLTIIAIIEEPFQRFLPSASLMILSALTYVVFQTRDRLSEIKSIINSNPETELFETLPINLWQEMKKNGEDVWLIGSTLHYVFYNETIYDLFKKMLASKKCSVKVLIRDPSKEMCQLAYKYKRDSDPSSIKTRIIDTLGKLYNLKKNANEHLKVAIIDYPLSFNIGALNPKSYNGKICVEFHGYKVLNEKSPKMILMPGNDPWYEDFKEQINKIWTDGKELSLAEIKEILDKNKDLTK